MARNFALTIGLACPDCGADDLCHQLCSCPVCSERPELLEPYLMFAPITIHWPDRPWSIVKGIDQHYLEVQPGFHANVTEGWYEIYKRGSKWLVEHYEDDKHGNWRASAPEFELLEQEEFMSVDELIDWFGGR